MGLFDDPTPPSETAAERIRLIKRAAAAVADAAKRYCEVVNDGIRTHTRATLQPLVTAEGMTAVQFANQYTTCRTLANNRTGENVPAMES